MWTIVSIQHLRANLFNFEIKINGINNTQLGHKPATRHPKKPTARVQQSFLSCAAKWQLNYL